MQKLGKFFLERTGHAATVAFLCALLPFFGLPTGFISLLIVAFVTLVRGWRSGLFVVAWVALPVVVLLYLRRFTVLDILVVRCLLLWMLACVFRYTGSWRTVFEVALILGVGAVFAVHLFVPAVSDWWVKQLSQYVEELNSMTSWYLTAQQSSNIIKELAPMMTGFAIFLILFFTWVLLFLARGWQSTVVILSNFRHEFIFIRNRFLVALVPLIALFGVLTHWASVIDVFPVLLFPLTMGGLSFVHFLTTMKNGFVVLAILMYVGILLLPFFIIAALAVAGWCDVWLDFRKRFFSPRS